MSFTLKSLNEISNYKELIKMKITTNVRDLPENAELITNSQDIDHVLESVGSKVDRDEIGCLFVLYGIAEIEKVWYCEYSTPHNHHQVYYVYDIDIAYYNSTLLEDEELILF